MRSGGADLIASTLKEPQTPTKMQVEAGHWKQSQSWQQDTTGGAALGIQTEGRGRLPEGSDRPVSGAVWVLCQEGDTHRVEAHR